MIRAKKKNAGQSYMHYTIMVPYKLCKAVPVRSCNIHILEILLMLSLLLNPGN